jgi:ADP-ribose pyrophosphatase YjhB (NUDIX family)
MPDIAVSVAVLYENQILLTQRDDFEVWCLPSGGVEEGESLAQAAIRETKEETGVDVELKSLVGVYSRLSDMCSLHAVHFTAVPIGGEMRTQPGETIDVRYFSFDEIPENMSPGQRQRIDDTLRGIGGSTAVLQEILPLHGQKVTREDIFRAREMPREQRLEFYEKVLKHQEIRKKVEVGPGSKEQEPLEKTE